MRKFITVTGILVIAALAIAGSRSSKVEAPVGSAPISPHEIMVKQGNDLPVDYWAHPF
jgi:hypothetical protein